MLVDTAFKERFGKISVVLRLCGINECDELLALTRCHSATSSQSCPRVDWYTAYRLWL